MGHRQTKILRPDGRWEVRCSVHDQADGPYPQTFPNEEAADQYAQVHLLTHQRTVMTPKSSPGPSEVGSP